MGTPYASKQRLGRNNRSETLLGGSVMVGDQYIYYEASGDPEVGPTVLFLHESGGSSATWYYQLIGLAASARCIVPDLPGHGRSEGNGYPTVEAYRQAVLGFLDALAIRWPVAIVGVCLGSAIAVDLALHAPHRVAGLVLGGVSERGRTSEETRAATRNGEAPDGFVNGLFGEAVSSKIRRDRLQRWYLTNPVVRAGGLQAEADYALFPAVTEITHPTLLIAGEMDEIATPELARALAARAKQTQVQAIANAGCLAMLEQPEAYNRSVHGFSQGLDPAYPIAPQEKKRGGYRRFS